MQTRKLNTTQKILKIACIVGLSIGVPMMFNYLTNSKKKDTAPISQILVSWADSVNKICPLQLDSQSILINAVALPNSTIQYNYSTKLDTARSNMVNVKKNAAIYLLNNVIKAPANKLFRDSGVTFIYNYTDTNYKGLFSISFPPAAYK